MEQRNLFTRSEQIPGCPREMATAIREEEQEDVAQLKYIFITTYSFPIGMKLISQPPVISKI